jgi:hypothetical protein
MQIFRLDVRAAFAPAIAPFALAAAVWIAAAAPDKATLTEQQEPHTPIAIDPKLLDAYAGFYRNAKTGSVMVVTRDGDHLLTRRAGNPPVPEYPYTDHDFFLTVAPQQNSFVTDAAGAVIRVIHHQRGQHETLERVSAEEGEREAAAITQRLASERGPHSIVSIDAKLLDAYTGFYRNPTTSSIMVVTRDGDHLLTRRAGNPPVPEYPYTDHDFFLTAAPQQNSFVADASGAVIRVIHHQMGQEETLERIGNEEGEREVATRMQRLAAERAPHSMVSIDPHLIGQYVGRYRNAQWEITTTREGNQLFAEATGFGRYPVYPFTDHDFFATILPAQISFVADGGGKATQLVLHQGGMDHILIRLD